MSRRHATRMLCGAIVVAVLAAACSSSGATTTTDGASTTTAGPATTTAIEIDPAYDEQIGLDPEVRTGVLDNGLTYYVRENAAPGSRLQLRLAIDAGSLLEDADQRGVAHFLEHMLFNGTERWPKNELVTVLESFGAQFGPDVNAYTSFDETAYQLVVPTDDGTVELAFDVLREWASRATLAEEDVVAERGVVIEEWRLRDQGIGGRIGALFEQLLITGTDYEGRSPIGVIDVLQQTDAEMVRRFYTDWYRPDLMAVIAVGDLPVERLEQEIVDRFADLPTVSAARERFDPTVSVLKEARVVTFADPDLPSAFAEFLYPGPASPAGSYGVLRDQTASQVGWDMVARRLDDDIVAGSADFFGVNAVELPYARGMFIPGIEIDADADKLGSAVKAAAEEIERVRRYGFSEAELNRAIARGRASVEQQLASQGTRQDVEFADALVASFLSGVPLPSARDTFDLQVRALDELTIDLVEARFLDTVAGAPAVLAVGPDAFADAIPTDDQIAEILDFVATAAIEARADEGDVAIGLMEPPEPAEIVDRASDIFDITWLRFGNGAIVGLIPTPIAENTVVFGAASPGGYSVFDVGDVTEASSISDIVGLSGVGDFDRTALDRLLTGEVAFVAPYMTPVEEGLSGQAASEDLETMLQLAHLLMTEPRADAPAVDTYLSQITPIVEAPLDVPGVAGNVTLIWERYGVDNIWYGIPPIEEYDKFDVDAAVRTYRDRFGDVGDFVFVLAGDFDPTEVEPLVASYLGTLPGTNRADGAVDRQPDPPPGAIVKTVRVGTDPQGDVTFLVTGELDADANQRIHARLLALVVSTRLRDRLREALSATYSPVVLIDTYEAPDPIIETFIQVSGDPARLAEISTETIAVLRDLATVGPTAAELATAQEQLVREYELVSNEFWVDTLIFYALHPDESIVDVGERIDVVASTTTDELRALASSAWPSGNYIEVRQIPR